MEAHTCSCCSGCMGRDGGDEGDGGDGGDDTQSAEKQKETPTMHRAEAVEEGTPITACAKLL